MKPKRVRISRMALASVALILGLSQQVGSWQLLEPLAVPKLSQPANSFGFPASETTNEAPKQQQPEHQPAPSSMAGKILDAIVGAKLSTETGEVSLRPDVSSSSGSSSSNNNNRQHQVLKPRKSSAESATKDIQQQIIQQHATIQQHLSPTKKFSSAPPASSFGESDGRDSSALSSIFDNFKSGITSRSTIVKAISDNKLARTLTDVGKTIGSNKYVAGAAAASALAALGLAVSKLLTPYMFAGGFSGGETLMPSGSSMPETFANPSRLSYGDFNSAPMGFTGPFGAQSTFAPPQFTASMDQTPASSYMETASSMGQPAFITNGVYVSSQGADGNYILYTPRPTPSSAALDQSQTQQRQQQPISSDVNGHYAQYYDGQHGDQSLPIGTTSYGAQQPMPAYSQQQQQQRSFISSGDQMTSASIEEPSYAAPSNLVPGRSQLPVLRTPTSPISHRSSSVRIKLKGARTVKAQPENMTVRPALADNYPHAGDKSSALQSQLLAGAGSNQPGGLSNLRFSSQQQQTNSMTAPTNGNNNNYKDQGQPLPQANGNNNAAAAAAIKIIRRQTATSDRLEAERHRSSNPWISVEQQQQQQLNPIDHQAASSGQQQERVFRTTPAAAAAKDYDSPQADTFETRQLSGDISAAQSEQLSVAVANNDVIKPMEANTKSGKLAPGHQHQHQQESSASSLGGLSVMQAPRQLLLSHNGHAGDQMAADEASASPLSSADEDSNSREQSAAQRRGQSAQGNPDNVEESS